MEELEHRIYQVIELTKSGLEGVALYYEGIAQCLQVPELREALSPEARELFTEEMVRELLAKAKELREAYTVLQYFESDQVRTLLEAVHARPDLIEAMKRMTLGVVKIETFLTGKSTLPPM